MEVVAILSPRIAQLLQEIEQMPLEQQDSIADALSVEIADEKQGQMTLAELIAELDNDIANGDIYALDEIEKLP